MKHIGKTHKKASRNAFEIAKQNNINSLYKVYSKFSTAKYNAFQSCNKKRLQENAVDDGYIIGSNCMQFTFAFETLDGLRVETACNSYIIY